jgi:hypothetical protein
MYRCGGRWKSKLYNPLDGLRLLCREDELTTELVKPMGNPSILNHLAVKGPLIGRAALNYLSRRERDAL